MAANDQTLALAPAAAVSQEETLVSRPTIGNYVVRFGQFWSRFGIHHDLCNLPVVVGSIIVPEVSVDIVMKYLKGFYN